MLNSPEKAIDTVTACLPKLNTPMYDGLESNLPHTLMQFSETPFPATTQLFASQEVVLHYLEDYAKDVMHLIHFGHEVNCVRPTKAKKSCGWEVTRVLLVGGGPSGADISNQIAAKCRHPLLRSQTVKSPYHTNEPHIQDYPGLVALLPQERAARFADGSIAHDIDDVILCTGYSYQFPFLKPLHPDVEKEGIRALPLYQHIFHIEYPTLAFIEIPEMIVPFPLAECQAAAVARVWSGRLPLPSHDAMDQWRHQNISKRGPGRGFHALEPPADLKYMKEMYDWVDEAENMKTGETGTRGKMPRYWDMKSCWLRMMAAEIKKAFNAKGSQRSNIKSYEELGFVYNDQTVL
ncbi:MAG: hypothetical protein Q9209_005037 [Squamulea sp. 1 TL-2023]